MAVAVVAGLASASGAVIAAGGFAGLSLFGLGVAGSLGAAFAIGAGLSMVSRALMPKPSMGQQMVGLDFTVREPDATRKMIYGRTRVGGAVVFIDTTDGDDDKNEYIHMVIAFAGHEVDAFEKIYANQEKIWDNGSRTVSWQPYLDVNVHNGDQTAADAELVARSSKWTTDHKLLETAYVYIRLKYDAEFFANGLPNISATIRGKKVYDPRKDSTSSVYDNTLGVSSQRLATPSTWQFSHNPALCIYDYLRDTKYGLSESASDINSAALATAISLCDQDVALAAGGNQARYTLDGVIDTANSKKENIEAMLSAMSGKLVYSSGEYFVSGGAYVAPSVTIDESVMIGGLEVQTKQSRRSLYNGVKGIFRSEEDDYNAADYPAQLSSTYSAADGDPIYLDMALPFTTNNIRAQRIAKLALLQSRQQTTITVPCNLTALKFRAGDTVMITNAKMGWSQKVFQVIGYDLSLTASGEIVVNVQAIETAAAIYDWTSSDEEDYLAGGELDLYDGKTAQPPVAPLGLTASSTVNADGTVTPTINVSWTAASDSFTDYYLVQWYNSTSGGTAVNSSTKTTAFTIGPVEPASNYAVTVYAYNGLGVRSTALTGNVLTISDTTPKLPSLYQAVTDSSLEPTAAQFTTVAGRNPKNGDVLLATDTTTATDTVHSWTYSTASSSWSENTNFISGDLIVDGSITGDQVSATTKITAGTGDNVGVLDGADTTYRIYAGNATPASAPFRVTQTGVLTATGAVIDGDIKADTLDVINANIFGTLSATSVAAGSITVNSLSQAVFAEFDDRYGVGDGFYVFDDDEFFDGDSTKYVTTAQATHSDSHSINFECTLISAWSWNISRVGDKLKANVSFEYSADNTNWTTVPNSSTTVVTATSRFLTYYTAYQISESVQFEMAGSALASGDYYFRVKIQALETTNAFQLDFNDNGVPVVFEVQQGSGILSAGGNANTLDGLDSIQFLRSDVNDTFDGNLTVTGDLTVSGTTTTINSTVVDIADLNITVAANATTDAEANNGGLTVGGSGAELKYLSSGDKWTTNKPLDVSGTISATDGDSTNWNAAYGWGDHATAGYLTSYTDTNTTYSAGTGITLTGTEFSLTDTDAKLNLSGGTLTGDLSLQGNLLLTGDATATSQDRTIDFTGFDKEGTTDFTDRAYIQHTTNTGGHAGSVLVISSQNDSDDGIAFETHSSSQLKHNSNTIWTAGNDGSGSGLDADTLDGYQSGYFATQGNLGAYLQKAGGTMTGALSGTTATFTSDSNALTIRTESGGLGAEIRFSDQISATPQFGYLTYFHADTASYGSGNAFIFGSSETTTTILADGKLMYGEGLYLKPATGTGAGTRKDLNWDTAYGWGDHSTAGYLTSYTDTDTTYSVGDGGLTENNFTNADHTKLDGIAASANNYSLANLNAHLTGGVGNIVTSGYIRGPADMVIDPAAHGDDTGTVTIAGNLTVSGTTTTIDSNTISLGDNLIVFNGDLAANQAPTETTGFTVNRGSSQNVSLHWNEAIDKWTASDGSGVAPYNYPILNTKNFESEITILDGGTF